jgi:hypothetical protein
VGSMALLFLLYYRGRATTFLLKANRITQILPLLKNQCWSRKGSNVQKSNCCLSAHTEEKYKAHILYLKILFIRIFLNKMKKKKKLMQKV